MRTSVDIPDPILRRARRLARERGTTLKQLIVDGLRNMVEPNHATGQYRMKNVSFGSGGMVEGLSWSDSDRMNELVYGDRG